MNYITSGVYLLPEYSWPGVRGHATVEARIVGIIYMVDRAEVESVGGGERGRKGGRALYM